ncbi:IS1595 family transposase, partial [Candidatus Liberibacter solanacearum]
MSKKPEFISLYQFFQRFDTEEKATEFYEMQRWPTGIRC